MDENKNIERLIRESFEGINKNAPGDLWGKLSDELSSVDPLDLKVKETYVNQNASAPDFVWDKLNRQLNIDRVWNRLNKSLDKKPVFYLRRIAGIAALLLLLIGIWYFFDGQMETTAPRFQANTENENGKSEIPANNPSSASKNATNSLQSSNNAGSSINKNDHSVTAFNAGENLPSGKQIGEEYVAEPFVTNNFVKVHNSIKKNIEEINQHNSTSFNADSLLEFMPLKTILITASTIDTPFIALRTLYPDTPAVSFNQRKKKLELGLTYAFNNTWVLNNATFSGFDKNSSTLISPAYAASYGVIINYNINPKNAFSSEIYINARYRQKYSEYREGHLLDEVNEFNYTKMTFLYQRNFSQLHKIVPSKYVLKAGLYGMYLKNHIYNINGKIRDSEIDDYKYFDYGLKLAVGQEKTFGSVIAGYGLNGEYGLANIFSGNQKMSSGFNHTRNTLIGAYFSIKYAF